MRRAVRRLLSTGCHERPALHVTIRYFAVLRERRGCDSEVVDLADGASLGEIYARLFPEGPSGRIPVGFALNHSWAAAADVPADGDEIAFIPPLGGG